VIPVLWIYVSLQNEALYTGELVKGSEEKNEGVRKQVTKQVSKYKWDVDSVVCIKDREWGMNQGYARRTK